MSTTTSRQFLALEPVPAGVPQWLVELQMEDNVSKTPKWLADRKAETARLERLRESRRMAMIFAGYRWDETSKRWVK